MQIFRILPPIYCRENHENRKHHFYEHESDTKDMTNHDLNHSRINHWKNNISTVHNVIYKVVAKSNWTLENVNFYKITVHIEDAQEEIS